jgi:hypothetical protein
LSAYLIGSIWFSSGVWSPRPAIPSLKKGSQGRCEAEAQTAAQQRHERAAEPGAEQVTDADRDPNRAIRVSLELVLQGFEQSRWGDLF